VNPDLWIREDLPIRHRRIKPIHSPLQMPFLLFPAYLFESGQREAPGNSYPSHFKDSSVNLVAKNRNKI